MGRLRNKCVIEFAISSHIYTITLYIPGHLEIIWELIANNQLIFLAVPSHSLLSLFQVYMGQLRNKCVIEWPGIESGVRNWTEWVLDDSHWYMTDKGPLLCGNTSGAR